MWRKLALLTIICATNSFAEANEEISCKDENDNSVDWFYLYKLPGRFGVKHQLKGKKYLYFTSSSSTTEWIESEREAGDVDSIPGRTISQAFVDNLKVSNPRLVVAYNDEPPNKSSNSKKGHTKGLVVADDKTGFWLVHSVPLFPNITNDPKDYAYPETGTHYGQSFLCLSLNADQINIVGKQLLFNEPQIYESKITDALEKMYPNFERLLQHNTSNNDAPYWNKETIKTRDNVVFEVFAKSGKFEKDLYEDWVAPTLNTDLYVETWRHGPGNLPSNCSKINHVWNISRVKVNAEIDFETTEDHSKWGVSDKQTNWICVGDINRAEHQKQRGGGTVCQNSPAVSHSYRTLINGYEPCEKP